MLRPKTRGPSKQHRFSSSCINKLTQKPLENKIFKTDFNDCSNREKKRYKCHHFSKS